ncbi:MULTISPECIES: mandelate racemase/muconate lactonizing enzyme family protein [unclassified Bradyrhizobium]|uniref:mandelate racemase/muconate lactonizing enzyme family protein n=1 Tax=unclassified Bradyrhizobium TaxID=2631580 RepID=UPI0024790BDD|nr:MULTISPECIES: mandelate racemase/muconate lactonizing enzyme family protein [unclassified Bradyrhizobium]WGR70172.1 mandelate racemase/muconate lactonizing enzyme family protein [Bradyrhizobium sp. ISRA426]WGR82229.1 mandelate racemase/muconate lactonizing enzyme family protein [Bradyrhizobium sp. ISRA430]WGR85415.1 mandelate racemase/muconate lactonizing enzyme family protein [Bradyrhizobium sp. ISRA432]
MTSPPFTIRSVQAFGYRYPLTTPVITSFGRMADRPAVFIRVEDMDGNVGWGEAWCNFPAPGAEHRVRLVNEVLAPALAGFRACEPSAAFERLTQGTAVLALQSGEAGPFAQSIAGIDLAVWDLHARRQNVALWKLLGGSRSRIRVYASGINPIGAERTAEAALGRGYRALKLKIGFDPAADRSNLAALRRLVGEGMLATDVNQGWTIAQALELAPQLEPFGLAWLEEPIRADRPQQEWKTLRQAIRFPLAAGENIASRAGFAEVLGEQVLGVVQPDIAKWGGLSICAGIARDILKSGKMFCPHYLGAGIGLLASAHLLAGVGGDGLLEVDCNENPLRDRFCGPVLNVRDGMIELGDEAGLGIVPDLASIEQYRTA